MFNIFPSWTSITRIFFPKRFWFWFWLTWLLVRSLFFIFTLSNYLITMSGDRVILTLDESNLSQRWPPSRLIMCYWRGFRQRSIFKFKLRKYWKENKSLPFVNFFSPIVRLFFYNLNSSIIIITSKYKNTE